MIVIIGVVGWGSEAALFRLSCWYSTTYDAQQKITTNISVIIGRLVMIWDWFVFKLRKNLFLNHKTWYRRSIRNSRARFKKWSFEVTRTQKHSFHNAKHTVVWKDKQNPQSQYRSIKLSVCCMQTQTNLIETNEVNLIETNEVKDIIPYK